MSINRLLTCTAMVLALSGYAMDSHGQTAGSSNAPAAAQPSGDTGQSATNILTQQSDKEMRANTLIGASVRNPQDEKVGKIQDLVLDENGSISAAVISVGGFLGIGDKHVAVPWHEVKLEDGGKTAVIAMNKDQLKAAPSFKTREEIQAEKEADAARQRANEQTRTPGQPSPVR